MLTTNIIVVEVCALLQRRIGMEALKLFIDSILPIINIEWVDKSINDLAISKLIASSRRGPNIVDWISFVVMKKYSIDNAFSFDKHFEQNGFSVLD